MSKVKSIPLPEKVADHMCSRLSSLEATVRCIRGALDGGEGTAEWRSSNAAEALFAVAEEIERISCDMDISTWGDHEAKEAQS